MLKFIPLKKWAWDQKKQNVKILIVKWKIL